MITLTNPHDLAEHISNSKYKTIGVDGYTQTGKTPFAQELADRLPRKTKAIHLDRYITKESKTFIGTLDIKKISDDINKYNNSTMIIEGTMLLKILDELNTKCDLKIFMYNKISEKEKWDNYFIESTSLETIIKEREETENKKRKAEGIESIFKLSSFDKALYSYFLEYKPQLQSDIIYINNYKEANS